MKSLILTIRTQYYCFELYIVEHIVSSFSYFQKVYYTYNSIASKHKNFLWKLNSISNRYFRRRQIAEIYLNFAIAKQNYQSKEKLSLFAKMINNHFSNFLFLSGNILFFFLILSSNAFSVSASNPFYLRIVLS